MSGQEKEAGFNVAKYLKGCKAADAAVQWAEPYGNDVRSFWNDCEYGELMTSMAIYLQVPFGSVIRVVADCLKVTVDGFSSDVVPPGIHNLIQVVERFSIRGGVAIELKNAMIPLENLLVEYREGGMISHPTHRLLEAALSMAASYLHTGGVPDIKEATALLSSSLQASASAKADALRYNGESLPVCRKVFSESLHEFADHIRVFIPYEVLISGVVRTAIVHQAMMNGEKFDDGSLMH